MHPLSRDYDADPGRFLATDQHPHDDVHPSVAARFAVAGARTVLDVGGGHGRLTRLLPGLGLRALLVDLSPAMLELAPAAGAAARRPVRGVRAEPGQHPEPGGHPRAGLGVIDGMGHNLPPGLWDELTSRIAELAGRTERGRAERTGH